MFVLKYPLLHLPMGMMANYSVNTNEKRTP